MPSHTPGLSETYPKWRLFEADMLASVFNAEDRRHAGGHQKMMFFDHRKYEIRTYLVLPESILASHYAEAEGISINRKFTENSKYCHVDS